MGKDRLTKTRFDGHSLAPWVVISGYWDDCDEGEAVWKIRSDGVVGQANKNLIEAAPALLSLLKRVVEIDVDWEGTYDDWFDLGEEVEALQSDIRKQITSDRA